LAQVKSFGLPVIGELELAAHYLKGKMLAVTGSNGKTTTTTLLGEILEAGGLPTLVGGNIGVPVISLIESSTDASWSVLEISSFQLETTFEFHPSIAVILNITPDHLDRHGSFDNYVRIKERIFAAQTEQDCLVLNAGNAPCVAAAERAAAQVYWFSNEHPVEQGACVENVLAAVCSARLAGVSAEAIRSAVEKFKAVEHRLEYVATRKGVEFYNDSKATNVDATAKAIAAFSSGIHLILGGKDKGSPYTVLADLLRERASAVYTIGVAAPKIEADLRGVVPILSCETLQKAVAAAAAAARPGEVVVLAPACSSYDQFDNYEQRGRVFKQLVTALRD
jgi:UDP-N-acetylmuramoylalanine--D-glutamate ligase